MRGPVSGTSLIALLLNLKSDEPKAQRRVPLNVETG